ncbi:MAG: hypothetical protein BWZ02_01391 [Lentisphaerae bacterium ADurb.BinA184]|nr:MAG: hypothetical protein BWZ02_01391 [Lentisphaerae bacterium ADurb.BinA184]
MRVRPADGGHNPLADPRDDGLLTGPADHPLDPRTHGHPHEDTQLDAVTAHREQAVGAVARGRAGEDLRADAGAHRLAHIASGQINGGQPAEVNIQPRLRRLDRRLGDPFEVAAGQQVRLELVLAHGQPALGHGDHGVDHQRRVNLAQPHRNHAEQRHLHPRGARLQPQIQEGERNHGDNQQDEEKDAGHDVDEQHRQYLLRPKARHVRPEIAAETMSCLRNPGVSGCGKAPASIGLDKDCCAPGWRDDLRVVRVRPPHTRPSRMTWRTRRSALHRTRQLPSRGFRRHLQWQR